MQEQGEVLPNLATTNTTKIVDHYDFDRVTEPDPKKLREHKNKSGSKNRARRSANRRLSFTTKGETETLRSELATVHKTYLSIFEEKDKEIESLQGNLLTMSKLAAQDIDSLQKELTDTLDNLKITEDELTIFQKSEKEWIGRTLKLKFIFDQMKKIGALPEDQRETWEPMVEQIDIPEVSINVKDEFVPTAQTDNIDWVSSDDEESDSWESEDEGDIIGEYLENETSAFFHCTNCGEMNDHATCDCPLHQVDCLDAPHRSIDDGTTDNEDGSMMNVFVPRMEWNATAMYNYRRQDGAILEKSATTIQKAWRSHQLLKKEKLDRELDDFMYCRRPFNKWEWDADRLHDDYAIVIQRVWRGHHLRKLLQVVFLYYSGVPFPAEQL
jgi:Holliday junction resolvase RusA-like endonuclease